MLICILHRHAASFLLFHSFEVTTSLQARIEAARGAFSTGSYAEALALYREAIREAPHHHGLYPAAARCLLRLHRVSEARALLQEHLSGHPDSVPGLIGLAEVERHERRWGSALEFYTQALRLQPDHIGIEQALRNLRRQLRDLPGTALGPPVCLTVISARLHTLPQVVASLQLQSLPPARIHLYLSREPHLLDRGMDPADPILQDLAEDPHVEIQWVPNLGPYRKFAFFLLQPPSSSFPSENDAFITVDDDTLYPPRFIEYLVRNRRKYNAIVAHRGRRILLDSADGYRPYPEWHDGLHEPRLANLPTGQSGVLYTRADFPADLELEAAMALAPTHDDLWLRWLTARQGVPAVVLQPNAAARTAELAFPAAAAPYVADSLWFAYNAPEAEPASGNDSAVRAIDTYFRARGFDLAARLRQEQESQADFY